MNISVIGAGYVGMITGVCFADRGNKVTFIDVDREKVDKINNLLPPIYEEGLEEMLKRNGGKIDATDDYAHLPDSDAIFICVGTPSRKDGSINLDYVKEAVRNIGEHMGDKWSVIVVKSTVLPGTTEGVVIPMLEKITGKKVTLARAKDIKKMGFEFGGIPCIGSDLKMIVDQKVLKEEYVFGSAGSPYVGIKIKTKDLVKLNSAEVFDICREV